ncbi:MAG: GyrI-like domain-containing protein [Bacteroidota bacterium]
MQHRKNAGATFYAYSGYESDYRGSYDYLIGEEVSRISDVPPGYQSLLVPAGKYVKLTSEKSSMPQMLIELWQKTWLMPPEELGGQRAYNVDYEIHHAHSADIYLGVEP